MAKRTGGGTAGDDKTKTGKAAPPKAKPDWRLLLAAAVIHYGTKRVVGPYVLTVPKSALRAAVVPGGVVGTYTPPGRRPRRSRSGRIVAMIRKIVAFAAGVVGLFTFGWPVADGAFCSQKCSHGILTIDRVGCGDTNGTPACRPAWTRLR